MSQTEELLNSLSNDDITTYLANAEEEPHIVVGDDRVITVPESLKRIAVQYDHNVETVTFDCPRYWDGLDMSKMVVYINYKLPNRMLGSYVADNVAVDENDTNLMHFTWTISRNVTEVDGNILFLVCIKKTDSDGNEENHWNSELNNTMYVSKGLETNITAEELEPDFVTSILTRIGNMEAIVTPGVKSWLGNKLLATDKLGNIVEKSFVELLTPSDSFTIRSNTTYYLTGAYNIGSTVIEGVENVTLILDNATIKYSGPEGALTAYLLRFANCHNITIIGGLFDGNNLTQRGLYFYNSNNCKVIDVEVKNIGNANSAYSAGVDFVSGCHHSMVKNSVVHDVISGKTAPDGFIHSVGLGMSSDHAVYNKHMVIDNVQIYNIMGTTSTINDGATDGDGIYIIQKPSDNSEDSRMDSHITIRNCHITKCSKRGIKVAARNVNIYNTYVDVDSWAPAVDFQLSAGKIVDSHISNASNISCLSVSWDNGKTSVHNCEIVGSGKNMGVVLNGSLALAERYTSEPQSVEVIGCDISKVVSAIHCGNNDGLSNDYDSLRFINNKIGAFTEKAISLYQDNAKKAQRIKSVKSIIVDGLYFKEELSNTQIPVYLGTSKGFINPSNTLKVVDGIVDFRNLFKDIPFTSLNIDFGLTKAYFDKVFQAASNSISLPDGEYVATGDTNREVVVTVANNVINITAANVTATRNVYIPLSSFIEFKSSDEYKWLANTTLTAGSYSNNATITFTDKSKKLISTSSIMALNGASKKLILKNISGIADEFRIQIKAGVTMTGQCTVSLTNPEPVFKGDLEARIAKIEEPSVLSAIGNGLTDDTKAIQNAIDRVTARGGVLRFPGRRTYVISKPLKISASDKNFEIDFGFSTITCKSAFEAATINGVSVNSALYIYTNTSNQKRMGTIKNLIVDGKRETIHTGLYLHLSSKIYYENINLINVRQGIYFKQGVESFFNNIHMSRESGLDIKTEIDVEATDCIGIDCYATDNHFSNIVAIDFVVGMKFNPGSGDNRVYGAHIWNYYCPTQYSKSVCFMNTGSNFYTNCVADHFFAGWYICGPGSLNLSGCNIACGAIKNSSNSVVPLNSYAFYFSDSNADNRTGSDIIVDNTRINGDANNYSESTTLTFSNVADCNINYSGVSQNCEKTPVPNIPTMVSGTTIIDDKNSSKVNQYGSIKSVEKVLNFESCSTNFSNTPSKTYNAGAWLSDYLQVSNKTSVAVSNNIATISSASDATGYNYLKLYLSKVAGIANGDFIMVAYRYKTSGKSKTMHYTAATGYTQSDDSKTLTGDSQWRNGYAFFTVTNSKSIYIGFGDGSTVDSANPLYLTDVRVINLSKYNIPKYYLENNKAYRARLIKLFGTAYATSVTIPARTDVSFASIPYKSTCIDIASESNQMVGFSSTGRPIISARKIDYKFDYVYTNSTSSDVVFELCKYTIIPSGSEASDNKKMEVYIDNAKICTLYNWSYAKNIVIPSGSTLKLAFRIPAGEQCMFSKLMINPYRLSTLPIVDSTGGYSKIPLYADGEIRLIAKNKSGADLPTAYFEVKYSKPYYTVEEFKNLESRIAALEAAAK